VSKDWLCFLVGKIPQTAIFLIIFLYQRAYANLGPTQIGFVLHFLTTDYADITDLTCFKLFSLCHRCRGRYGHGQPPRNVFVGAAPRGRLGQSHGIAPTLILSKNRPNATKIPDFSVKSVV